MEREKLGSRLGFILLSAGCAIGIGNVWKFPYVAGQNGGGIFLLFYLFFLAVLGLPVLCMEFSLGRASQKSPARLYDVLAPQGSHWHWHGKLALVGNFLLMMFYTVVAGWMVRYFIEMCLGTFTGASVSQVQGVFDSMLADPIQQVLYTTVVIVLGFAVCAIGLQNGLEKITKVIMTSLLAIMVLLAGNAILQPGAAEGLRYFLYPDFSRLQELGTWNVITAAMNQAFFTLSLGLGSMAIFGSYIDKDHSLLSESINVTLLDTFVAIIAGLIIIPSCFAYNVEVSAGPSLIFVTLPNIFTTMPFGRLWGALFFLFLSFAAFSTVFAVFENIISGCMDLFGWSRRKACLLAMLMMLVAAIPAALGPNLLSHIQPLGAGTTIMDLEDFIVSNWMLPLGSVCFVLFCTTKAGWGWNSFLTEANAGKGLKVPVWIHKYCQIVLPLIIIGLFAAGLISWMG